MTTEVILRETPAGVEILSGSRRLNALLATRDEVVITTPDMGEVVVARLPDGRLCASANPGHIQLFR